MTKLKVPSLQHLARNWRENPDSIRKVLVALVRNSPTFNYGRIFDALTDLLVLHQSYEQVAEGIRRIKREDVRNNFLEILPLIRGHFDGVSPDFIQKVGARFYPVGRELMVPFEPPFIYGLNGQIYFPWFSFWRQNPLAAKRLSLFVTMVDEVLLQDPDLENTAFEILDFSVPGGGQRRELRIINARDVPRLTDADKGDMLATFAEGYFMAKAELAGETEQKRQPPYADERACFDQLRLFD